MVEIVRFMLCIGCYFKHRELEYKFENLIYCKNDLEVVLQAHMSYFKPF